MMRPSFYYFGFAAVIPWNPDLAAASFADL
jgi:hypothetical protein